MGSCIPWSPKARNQGHPASLFSSTWVGLRPMETRLKSCPDTKHVFETRCTLFPYHGANEPSSSHSLLACRVHRWPGPQRHHGFSSANRARLACCASSWKLVATDCRILPPAALGRTRERGLERNEQELPVPRLRHGLACIRSPGPRRCLHWSLDRSRAQQVGDHVRPDCLRRSYSAGTDRRADPRHPAVLASHRLQLRDFREYSAADMQRVSLRA